ncbi:MAG TPA: asparagine synthase B [Myxococcota bacterium]|nr:asparagine synthase B [Myxococcota bacterium]
MCGILAVIDPADPLADRASILEHRRLLRHRGPDWSGVWTGARAVLAHERLAIVDPESGEQPLTHGELALAANGEIYNHAALRKAGHPYKTGSDCEVILSLYEDEGAELVHRLDGQWAFVLVDDATGDFVAARDPIGVVPLYVGTGRDGATWFASEMKALAGVCTSWKVFPPGHVMTREGLRRWYEPEWFADEVPTRPLDPARLRAALEDAVVKRLMSDVPWGVLLSGGLDSSLVSAITAVHAARRVEDDEQSAAWWPRLHSFSIGLEGSPDLAAAAKVAEHLGTVHHPFTYTIADGIDALSDVIWHLETYDVTSIRASTPMYLMARKIRAMGIKMVLSGEGADEIFGGYLYFHKAPDAAELHHECVRKLQTLHLYDCLRANKSMMAWGVETRVPFLDKGFLAETLSFDPTAKMSTTHPDGPRMEKHLLRAAFDDEVALLPDEVLWRQKEQFSDGVGYGWIDSLKAHSEAQVSDTQLAEAAERFPYNPPANKEAYCYRQIFDRHFPQACSARTVPGGPSIACSTPVAIQWDEAFSKMADPSGRAVGVHVDSY